MIQQRIDKACQAETLETQVKAAQEESLRLDKQIKKLEQQNRDQTKKLIENSKLDSRVQRTNHAKPLKELLEELKVVEEKTRAMEKGLLQTQACQKQHKDRIKQLNQLNNDQRKVLGNLMQLKLMKQPSFQKDYSRDSLFSMCEEASALMNSKVDERLEAHQIALRVSEKEAIVE